MVGRRLQVGLAIFLAIFVFIILVHPTVDLPESTRPSRQLASVVISVIAILATLWVAVVKFALLLHPPVREAHYPQSRLYEGSFDGPVCVPLLC